MRINKRVFILTLNILVCAIVFCPKFIFAAGSVSVSSGTWALGTKKASIGTTSSSYTVTNDNSGGTEDVLISVGNSTPSGWTPSATTSPSSNIFVLQQTNSSGAVITGTNTTLVSGLANNGTRSLTLYFTTPASVTVGEGVQQTITVILTATNWVAWCPSTFSVTHTAGTVAPVTKTVTYGAVISSLSGASKCWITQNLGATTNAALATESTEPNAGWYWQFNRAAGWKYDTSLYRSSAPTTWNSSTDNTACSPVVSGTEWCSTNDPCTLLLGTGWRLPTNSEWTNANANGQHIGGGTNWANYNDTFADVLKLHAAGYLDNSTGSLLGRGTLGFSWSSTQYSSTFGYYLLFASSYSTMNANYKAYGFVVRCLKD